jgi:uncharacterized protein
MKILSLRGGGIRGVSTASFVAEMEDALGKPACELFDMIVGTSTGAILAVGLGLGLSAHDLLDFYLSKGPAIFKKRFGHMLGLVSSRYSTKVLLDSLETTFGYKRLSYCKTKVMVTTSRMNDLSARFWKSWKHNISAGLAAASSAAAPLYFDPIAIRDVQNRGDWYEKPWTQQNWRALDGDVGYYADGGLFANDPALAALGEAIDILGESGEPITILDVACPGPKLKAALGLGLFGFGPEVVDVLMEVGKDYFEQTCERTLGKSYHVVRPDIGTASPKLDDAKWGNVQLLRAVGHNAFGVEALSGYFGEDVKRRAIFSATHGRG